MNEQTQSKALFRIGGVYRQRNGAVVALRERMEGWAKDSCKAVFAQDYAPHCAKIGMGDGIRFLATGSYCLGYESEHDLLPGELHQVNGQWVPIEQAIDPRFAAAHYGNDLKTPELIEEYLAADGCEELVAAPIPFERPLSKREQDFLERQSKKQAEAEEAARKAAAKAEPKFCVGLLREQSMSHLPRVLK